MKFLLAGVLLIIQSFTVFSMQKKEIYLAGGCYWGLEYLLQDLPGVMDTEVGFAGGSLENATYDDVKTGLTGHAETIYITYDEEVLSLEQLLFEFFRMHNPTTQNQQGNDIGTQYRSAIFYVDQAQKTTAESVIAALQASTFEAPIVTELLPEQPFYIAEEEHQNYYNQHTEQMYCSYVINPKVAKLKEKFNHLLH